MTHFVCFKTTASKFYMRYANVKKLSRNVKCPIATDYLKYPFTSEFTKEKIIKIFQLKSKYKLFLEICRILKRLKRGIH